MRSPQNNWDFWTGVPESLHQVTILMSDRGMPKGFRNMHGFGSHTYSMYNDEGERVWVNHFRTQQGIENYTDEAAEIVGMDRRFFSKRFIMPLKKGIILNGKCISKL